MTKQDWKEWSPLLWLNLIVLVALVEDFSSSFPISIKLYVIWACILLLNLLFFLHRRFYKYGMGITVLLATFTPIFNILNYSVSITLILITIHILLAPALVMYVMVYSKSLARTIYQLRDEPQTEEEKREMERQESAKLYNSFKQRFSNLTDYEIERRKDRDLMPEALQALEDIRKERGLVDPEEKAEE
ncbi:hypothetical protein KFE98_21175 [bacterium SCSIO 12741]|nr:hypothetical protein KFE98_21175 [bacterium SCSIO 12741]